MTAWRSWDDPILWIGFGLFALAITIIAWQLWRDMR